MALPGQLKNKPKNTVRRRAISKVAPKAEIFVKGVANMSSEKDKTEKKMTLIYLEPALKQQGVDRCIELGLPSFTSYMRLLLLHDIKHKALTF